MALPLIVTPPRAYADRTTSNGSLSPRPDQLLRDGRARA